MNNQTGQDARDRLVYARLGSFAHNPSVTYLEVLAANLHSWLVDIDNQLLIAHTREERQKTRV